MKQMLTLFLLTTMCSFIFNSELGLKTQVLNKNQLELTTNNSLLTEMTQRRKSRNSTLRPGESVYSKNGKYIFTMKASNCRLILKEIEGKVLFKSQKYKGISECKAVLKGNSNLVIVTSKKKIIWSTKTEKFQRNKGPFRLIINSKGNVIVRNRKKECVWSVFGCPVSKKYIKKITSLPPSSAAVLLQKSMKKMSKRLNGLPIRPLPRAKGKPEIKNQIPATPQKKKIVPLKVTPLISKKKINRIKDLVNDGPVTKDSWKRLKRILGAKVKGKQATKLKKLLKTGNFSYKDLRKKALDAIKKKILKLKRNEVVKKKEKPQKVLIRTKKDLKNQIKKQPWYKNVRRLVKAGKSVQSIKKLLKKSANIKGNASFWRRVANAVKTRSFKKIVRLVSLPVKKPFIWKRPVYYPPTKRWVRAYRTYLTWRWASYSKINYVRHCSGRWWWRRCYNCNHGKRWVYYRYYYWAGTYYWVYK